MLTFRVLHNAWVADGEEFAAGEHEVKTPSKALVKLASHAHAAGAVEVTEGLDLSTVQSQEDGEAAYHEAQGEHAVENMPDGTRRSYWTGPWYEGQMAQAELDAAAREAGTAAVTVEVDAEAPAEEAAE